MMRTIRGRLPQCGKVHIVSEENREMNTEEAREELHVSLPMEAFKAALPYLLALLVIAGLGYWLIDPAPPKKMVISISKEDGNYQAYASLYGALLQQDGITLEIRETEGPMQSLEELRKEDSDVDLAFVPGGMAGGQSTVGLESLGSLYYEPLWIFHKGKQKIEHLSQLKGLRVGVGRPDSSTRLITKVLLDAAGVTEQNATLYEIGLDDSMEALRHDIVDVIFLTGVPNSPLIADVANMHGVSLVDLDDAEAISRQYSFLHHLVLPESALSLQANIPPRRAHLLAPTVTLVPREPCGAGMRRRFGKSTPISGPTPPPRLPPRRGGAVARAGASQSGRPASNTTLPPTTVSLALTSFTASGGISNRSRSSRTKSASIPARSRPFTASSPAAQALLAV
jgi:TRAP-type uncharacterized transport system substrate-binding protein